MSPAVYVLATSDEATTTALRAAREMAGPPRARVVLIAPIVALLSALCARGPRDQSVVVRDKYRRLSSFAGVDATVHVCICRRIDDIFAQLIPARSTIVMGRSRAAWFPWSAEGRLARRLIGRGYHVVLREATA